jgi:hypothetical protein
MGGGDTKTYGKSLFGMTQTGASSNKNWSITDSRSTSYTQSESETEGESESWTEGETRSEGESLGRSWTDGVSGGRGSSGTNGWSDTIHRRALVTPDELGRLFAAVRDKNDPRYPGFALLLIAGEQPVPVKRVNYYEDDYFLCCFDPHPDHEFNAPSFCQVTAAELDACVKFLETTPIDYILELFGKNKPRPPAAIHLKKPDVMPGSRVKMAKPLAALEIKKEKIDVYAPRTGTIVAVEKPGTITDPSRPVFKMAYYERRSGPLIAAAYRWLIKKCMDRRDFLVKFAMGSVAALALAVVDVCHSVYNGKFPSSLPELAALALVPLAALFGFASMGACTKCPRFIVHLKYPPDFRH